MKAVAFLALVSGVWCLDALAQDPHAGHHMPAPANPATSDDGASASAATLPVGDAAPPPVIEDSLSDRIYDSSTMARARAVLNSEHGGGRLSKAMANMLELADTSGDAGYRWDVEGWYGGDLHRFVVKSEGESLEGEVEAAEVQGLYSRAVGRYTDLQAGVRYDFEPEGLAYATVGVESLLPYWFHVEGALFLSERGDTFARLEGSYDLRFTQRLVLQPRVELTLAAQDVHESNIGSGFSTAEIGLRLRYDVRREFAPYIGINFETSLGRTADLVRVSGADVDDASVVLGLRAWF
jgi:copper resistance protein B